MIDNPYQAPEAEEDQPAVTLSYRLRVLFGACVVASVLLASIWVMFR